MHPIVAREILSTVLGGVDLTPYAFDGPLPDNLPMSNASQSTFKYVTELAKKDNLTMRQIAQVVAGARAKLVIKGTPKQVADMHGAMVRRAKPPTASTSCRRTCPARSTISSSW